MSRLSRVFSYAVLSLWSAICLFPLFWIVGMSVKEPFDVIAAPRYLPFVDFQPTLESWRYILFNPDDDTLKRYINSLAIAFGATALTLLLGALAAYGLTRLRASLPLKLLVLSAGVICLAGASAFLGLRDWIFFALIVVVLGTVVWLTSGRRITPAATFAAIVLTRVLPPVVIVLPVYYLIQKIGLLDTRTSMILVYTAANLPVALWLLRGFFEQLPPDIEDAAQVDGASRLRVFFTMIVPLARRALAATALLVFILCWNEYLLAAYLTTDHALTMPPFLAGQMATREQMASAEPEWGYFSVLIVLMVAPLIVFSGILQRTINRAGRGEG